MRRIAIAFALGMIAAEFVAAQDPRGVSFEAASIKSNPVSATGALRGRAIVCQGIDGTIGRPAFVSAGPAGAAADAIPQGRCKGDNVTLLTLVATAYGVSERDVLGGPRWVASDGFQVEAKADNAGTVTSEELRRMLRTLIVDRFMLSVRREQREGQAFVLTVRPNGLKIQQAAGTEQPLHTELSGQRGQQQVTLLGRSSIRDFVAVLASLPFSICLPGLTTQGWTNQRGWINVSMNESRREPTAHH